MVMCLLVKPMKNKRTPIYDEQPFPVKIPIIFLKAVVVF